MVYEGGFRPRIDNYCSWLLKIQKDPWHQVMRSDEVPDALTVQVWENPGTQRRGKEAPDTSKVCAGGNRKMFTFKRKTAFLQDPNMFSLYCVIACGHTNTTDSKSTC